MSRRSPRWLLLTSLLGAAACGGKALAPGHDASASIDGSDAGFDAEVMSAPDAVDAGDCLTGLVTAAELASTPRADTNLELLALKLSKGRVVADQAIYDRLVRDVAVLRAQWPELATIPFFPTHDGKTISLNVDQDTAASMKSGAYTAWQCLNTRLGARLPFDYLRLGSAEPAIVIFKLKGLYAIDVLAPEYGRLPGVITSHAGTPGDGSTICVTPGPDTWHYVIDQGSNDCPFCIDHTYFHFTTSVDGVVVALEQWSTTIGQMPPAWVTQYASRDVCR